MTAAVRVFERDLLYFRQVWRASLLGSLLQPFLYLLGVGVGVGALVDGGAESTAVLGDVSYFAFYSTALIATTAMFTAGQEALWPTMDGFTWTNAYRAMIATPLSPGDVAYGKALHFAFRSLIASGGVALVLVLFDETRSLGLIPATIAGMLTGLAFALPLAAWTASRDTDTSFPAIMRFVIVPMFLFGGVFYPIDQLPGFLQLVAWLTPLWHGVELSRGFILGGMGIGMAVGHFAILLAYCGFGLWGCTVTFRKRLEP